MIKFIRTTLLAMAALTVMPVAAQDDWSAFKINPKRCGTSMIFEREAAAAAKGHKNVISSSQNYIPHTGTVTIPVILVNFKDVKLTVNNPQLAFDQFFNATGKIDSLGNGNQFNHGSVSKYFRDMSGGQFNLKFKVYAPITLNQNETYYGGSNEENNDDEHPQWLVRDAVNALISSSQVSDADITSFSSDGKTIDCVYVIYAGMGQNNGGSATTVWACTSRASDTSIGGKNVRWFSMAGELSDGQLDNNENRVENGVRPLISGVGVSCHELTHALGFPDTYPTNKLAYLDNQEMEYWDLMDGGEYAGFGFYPTAYTAFEKSEMGWPVNIEELTENKSVSIANSTEKGGTAYKIANPQNSNEYFMLECIQNRGWNRGISMPYRNGNINGLLVYHVNRPTGGLTLSTCFNNVPNYPGMAVVPADGACLSSYLDHKNYGSSLRGDLFPGTGNLNPDTLNVTELSDAKPQPNFCWYNSAKTQKLATNKALRNIKYDTSTGVVSFDYIDDVATAIRNISVDMNNSADTRIYTIDGRYVGTDFNALPHGLYIRGGKKIIK